MAIDGLTPGWEAITRFDHTLTKAASGTLHHAEARLSKPLDRFSPLLARHVCDGTALPLVRVDVMATMYSVVGISMPVFWLGLLAIMVFSLRLRWLPAAGSGSLKHLIMPAMVIGLASAAPIAAASPAGPAPATTTSGCA